MVDVVGRTDVSPNVTGQPVVDLGNDDAGARNGVGQMVDHERELYAGPSAASWTKTTSTLSTTLRHQIGHHRVVGRQHIERADRPGSADWFRRRRAR